jgi:hypothetical protein
MSSVFGVRPVDAVIDDGAGSGVDNDLVAIESADASIAKRHFDGFFGDKAA